MRNSQLKPKQVLVDSCMAVVASGNISNPEIRISV